MALKPYRATAHWKKIRLQVLKRDAYTCAYCGDVANEVDHRIAKVKARRRCSFNTLLVKSPALDVQNTWALGLARVIGVTAAHVASSISRSSST